MSCNGRNHQPNCTCGFSGGRHSRSRTFRWKGWKRASIRSYSNGPWAKCPECQIGVYYISGPRGGGAFFDCLGPPWTLHPCTNKRLKYSPFGRAGRPKLRVLKTLLEKNGFLPLIVRRVERVNGGSILHGVVWDTPTALHLGTMEILDLDANRPVYVRRDGSGCAVVSHFPMGSLEPINIRMREDTLGPLDLLMNPPHKTDSDR